MKSASLKILVALAAITASQVASATYLVCTETVTPSVISPPATVTWDLTATDAWCDYCAQQEPGHWCHESCNADPPYAFNVVTGEKDEVLEKLVGPIAWTTTNPPGWAPFPFILYFGESVTTTVEHHFPSYAACWAWANSVGVAPDASGRIEVVDTFHVDWDSSGAEPHYAECTGKVVCQPPLGPTRTIGYFKTHPAAVESCVGEGPIDLGFMTVNDPTTALGLLWASPAKYASGAKRSALDQARVLLARQLLVAVCNGRVFGSTPADSALIDGAVTALAGRSCVGMNWLQGQLDAFNNSGDTGENWFGSAAPANYADPTAPSGLSCQ